MILTYNKFSVAGSALVFAWLLNTTIAHGQTKVPQLGKNTVKEVIAAMTLEEKAMMVIGGGRDAAPSAFTDGSMVGNTSFRIPGAAGVTNAIPRLGIPAMVLADGPAGVRMDVRRKNDDHKYFATAFPAGNTLASTWNPEVVKRVGEAFGNEVKEFGADIILAPGVNIHRNPLGGRNFEYYSEDPVLTGEIAAAIINGIQSNGVGTSIKHFAANNQEANRAGVNAHITERALREIYLKGFEIAIKKSSPWTVMSSYNLLNGTHTSERRDLLTNILRNEWNFKGYVMSDWGGKATNWVEQVKAGNDMIMPGNNRQIQRIISAVKHDSLDVKTLNTSVERVLNIIMRSPSFSAYKFSNTPDLKAHAKVSREAATEGMVLLKNEKEALPIKSTQAKVALFGNISYALIAGGWGSGDVNKAYTISLAKGLTNAGYTLDKELSDPYQQYNSNYRNWNKELLITDELIKKKAAECDIAVLTIGRNSGETKDRDLDYDYYLKPTELSLIERTAEAFHRQNKKLVVVLNLCGPIDTKGWREKADAILLAWQPGMEAGDAIADLMSGKVTPSGKLPDTFADDYNDIASSANFPGLPYDNPSDVIHQEDIYVGYRYFDTWKVKPAYEFGYGLSYTTFGFSPLKVSSSVVKDNLKVSLTVTNTGNVAGKEVVQLYLSAPGKISNKPAQELKAFHKTNLLQPGQSQVVTFDLPVNTFASFDNIQNAWVAEAGVHTLKAGSSSRQIRQTVEITIPKTIVTQKVNSVLHPQTPIEVIKPK
ncbi:glycoside hydrolase family 3 N-terminal domain-containing protein [uncultured Mucilaginibacter sp.]|uniref:glycoside hydrolase family 3 N-terminal domain-containing protein n=1 Tax=uncultured Mucilaginibacter sp. TaxID=797541 RepID=UPI0025EC7D84|nr:glycoside hydrolase family 3 N-terminal domain-containing protein [uncultured Mucilaginibacter sp.]